MKKRDKFWVNKILQFLLIILFFGIISIFNIIQFNNSYMQEEQEELQVFKRQIEWAITPIISKNDFSLLQQYCNDFKGEDVEFRIFDENKTLLASSNINNQTKLLDKDSKILNKKYNSLKLYRYSTKDKKIGIIDKITIKDHKYFLELTVSQADVMHSILSGQRNILIFIGICLLLFIIGLLQIFYTLRTTFNKLEDSVIEVANGRLETEIEIPKLDLLKELTLSIKKMTKRLKMQIARLTQLEQYKSDFLQNITHEIKTPITAINSAIELLQTKNSIKQEDKECFDIIQFQINSINKLINDILYLSEIEVEKTNENKNYTTFNLNQLIKNQLTYFNFSDIKINFIENTKTELKGNEELISTAISNLITNAIKYSGSNKIDIILDKKGKEIELTVKDYGIGIALDHINHIFERFYCVDKTRSRLLSGSGLGLAIVKNIINLHNGNISAESEINKGTSFIINLPIEK